MVSRNLNLNHQFGKLITFALDKERSLSRTAKNPIASKKQVIGSNNDKTAQIDGHIEINNPLKLILSHFRNYNLAISSSSSLQKMYLML